MFTAHRVSRVVYPLATALLFGTVAPVARGKKPFCKFSETKCFCDAAKPVDRVFQLDREELSMPDGSKYIGEVQNGLRSGYGDSWEKCGHYAGNWQKDMKQGFGIFEYNNGSIYSGDFENGLPHGSGVLTLRDGDIVEGTFEVGMLQDQNINIRFSKDGYYDLRKEDDRALLAKIDNSCEKTAEESQIQLTDIGALKDGDYLIVNPGGLVYEGHVVNKSPHGLGVLLVGSEFVCAGEFRDGEFHHGTLHRFRSNTEFEGDFQHFRLHGPGTIKLSNDTQLSGNFVHGKLQGPGVWRRNAAGWLETKLRGPCYLETYAIFENSVPVRMTGHGAELKNGIKMKATFLEPDGAVVAASYSDRSPGMAICRIRHKNGTVEEGKWNEKGFQGQCTVTHPDGRVDTGDCVDGCRRGLWTFTAPDRTVVRTRNYPTGIVGRIMTFWDEVWG